MFKNRKLYKFGTRFFSLCLCLFCQAGLSLEAYGEETGENGQSVIIEYDNLRELLKEGNVTLKQSIGEYETNLADYQRIWDIMKWEQGDMEDKAEEAEDAALEDAPLYSSNASMIKSSANRIYKQIENMTDTKSTRSLEAAADSYTMAAQTIMNSYNQMAQTVKAREKSVEALKAAYDETVKKQSIGSAAQSEVNQAQISLTQASNSLEALKEQESQLKNNLLTLLGLRDENHFVIGKIPEPDLTAIDSIDLETDKAKAVGNSAKVQEARHSSANSTAEENRRFQTVNEAEGTAEAEIEECFQQVQVKKTEYQAALSAYENSLLAYQSLQRKKQAGLLDKTSWLQGEADYLESLAKVETASMNLVSAYESYCWQVKGVTG